MSFDSSDPSCIYTDLYNFLEKHGLEKTLKAFKKESGIGENQIKEGEVVIDLLDVVLKAKHKFSQSTKEERRQIKLQRKRQRQSTDNNENLGTALKNNETEKKQEDHAQVEIKKVIEDLKQKYQNSNEEDTTPPKKKRKEHRMSLPADFHQKKTLETDHLMKSNTEDRFKRIDEQKWIGSVKNKRLMDQSYESKQGDMFAAKAAEELGRVRGRDFRREMQKKKRASWKGCGLIEDKINSIKFDSD